MYAASRYLDLARSFGAVYELLGPRARQLLSSHPTRPQALPGDRLDGTTSGFESQLPVRQSLLLLLEVMLLDERHSTRMKCCKRIASFLRRLESPQSGPDGEPAAAAATADALLHPVLHLAPPVLSAPASSSSSSNSRNVATAEAAAKDAAAAVTEFAWLVEFVITTGKSMTIASWFC
jgi:hypothetical protein